MENYIPNEIMGKIVKDKKLPNHKNIKLWIEAYINLTDEQKDY
jgi:hypothetical protein